MSVQTDKKSMSGQTNTDKKSSSGQTDKKWMGGQTKTDKKSLEAFWSLADSDEKQRQDASLLILAHVSQRRIHTQQKDGVGESVEYTVQRLVRGISSSRAAARQGFYCCLAQLLKIRRDITATYLLSVMMKEYPTSDKGEVAIGQVLTLGALLRSRELVGEEYGEIFTKLLSLSQIKTYTAVIASAFMLQIIHKAEDSVFTEHLWPYLSKRLDDKKLDSDDEMSGLTAESLMLLLAAEMKFPAHVKLTLKEKWDTSKLMSKKNITAIANILIGTVSVAPRIHPLVSVLAESLVSCGLVERFWLRAMVQHMEAVDRKNRSRIHILLSLATHILPKIADQPQLVEVLLTDKLVGCHLYLCTTYTAEEAVVADMNAATNSLLQSPTDTQLIVIKQILQSQANINYDKATHGSTLQNYLSRQTLPLESLKAVCSVCLKIIDGTAANTTHKHKKYAAIMLARVLKHPSARDEVDWKLASLLPLLKLSLFKPRVEGVAGRDLPVDILSSIQSSLFRVLEKPEPNITQTLHILLASVREVNRLIKESTVLQCRKTLSTEDMESWVKIVKLVEKLAKKSSLQNGELTSAKRSSSSGVNLDSLFLYLLTHVALQMLTSNDVTADILQELVQCYKQKAEVSGGWVSVVIDILIKFLSSPSRQHLFRVIGTEAFTFLIPLITSEDIKLITDALDPEQDLFVHESSDSEDESDEEENKPEESSDEDMDDKDEEGDDEEESDDDDDEDSSSDEDGEPDTELEKALEKALGPAAATTDEPDEVDVDDMDEDSQKRLDTALAAVFKSSNVKSNVKNQRKNKEKRKQMITNFRIRCLDFILAYVRSQSSVFSITLSLIPNLVQCLIQTTKQADYSKKLQSVLIAITKKPANTPNYQDLQGIPTTVKDLHQRAAKANSIEIEDVISMCCTFLVKTVNASSKSGDCAPLDEMMSDYKQLLTDTSAKLPVSHLYKMFSMDCGALWSLMDTLITHAFSDDVRLFRRKHGLGLLYELYNNRPIYTTLEEKRRVKLEKKLNTNVCNFLVVCSSSGESKSTCLVSLLKLLHLMRRLHNTGTMSGMSWDDITQHLTTLHTNKPHMMRANNKHWKELAQMLHIDVTKQLGGKQKKAEVMDLDENNVEIPETNHRVNGVGKKQQKKKKKTKFAGSNRQKKSNWDRMQGSEWDPTRHVDVAAGDKDERKDMENLYKVITKKIPEKEIKRLEQRKRVYDEKTVKQKTEREMKKRKTEPETKKRKREPEIEREQ